MKRMKMMKKAAIWMLTASMAAGLTACGGSGAEAEDTGDISDPESVKGTITVGGWPSGDDAFKAALEGFQKEYPNVEVKFQFTDTTAHHQALQLSLIHISIVNCTAIQIIYGVFCLLQGI